MGACCLYFCCCLSQRYPGFVDQRHEKHFTWPEVPRQGLKVSDGAGCKFAIGVGLVGTVLRFHKAHRSSLHMALAFSCRWVAWQKMQVYSAATYFKPTPAQLRCQLIQGLARVQPFVTPLFLRPAGKHSNLDDCFEKVRLLGDDARPAGSAFRLELRFDFGKFFTKCVQLLFLLLSALL